MFKNQIVKFGAAWCNPCTQASKYLKEKFSESQYTEVDVTENEELAQQFGIRNIPTFITFNSNGDIIDTFTGFDKDRINQAVDKIS